jgi:predicted dehydrogenase
MSDPRICIVGAGNLSTKRIYPYIGAAGAVLVGVCDVDREKAERNARRFGGTVYDDMERMLASEKPDGVIICIDMDRHAELAMVAMRAGFPVHTEKPPAPSAAAALEVARVSRETGQLCTTAFKKRYNAAYSRATEWLSKYPVEDRYALSIDYSSGQARNDTLRRTFLFDFAVHCIDLAGFLFGGVEKVAAFSRGQDAFAASLKYSCGAVGSLSLNCGRAFQVPTEEVELTVKGGNFMTVHNSSCWRITEEGKPAEWREPPTYVSAGDSGYETGHLAEIEDFFAAIREQRTTRSNIYESYKSMVLYEAIRDSAASGGEAVELKYEAL